MCRAALLDKLQRLVELGLRIMGQGQHDVAADVLEPGPACGGESGPRLLCRVGAAQRLELTVPGRLDAEGDAVDARLPECPERVFGHGLRVGFQRDLGPGQGLCGGDEPGGVCRVQQTGRSTAEIKGVRPQGRVRRKPGEFPKQSVHIGPGDAALAGGRVKITVPAFGKTVRNMQIKSEGHQISQPFS